MAISFRKFRASLGPVEQAQVVVSAAVVGTLVTILVVRMSGGMYRTPEWLLFGSILTVGVFGFLIVLLTLKYGRLLEEQKQELLALKTMAESVNRAVDRRYLIENALQTLTVLLDIETAWLFQLDGFRLSAAASRGTDGLHPPIALTPGDLTEEEVHAIRAPQVHKAPAKSRSAWPDGLLQSWASVPILMKDQLFGLIVVGSRNRTALTSKQLDLMSAFANQIGVAVENALLFDRVRKSEERYTNLFEHSPDINFLVNREGIIVSCNQTAASHLGFTKEELVGYPVFSLYPAADHEQARARLREIFDNARDIAGIEERLIKQTGEIIDVSVNTTLMPGDAETPALVHTVARDITEKKRLDAQIIHAQRIDSIGNLAGGISHDFNNILTSILGSTAIMKRKMKKTDTWYHFADIIETAARRGAALTRQLLTFARKGAVHFRPVVIPDIIEETLRLFERSIDKTITISYSPPTEFSLINGDDGQIQQALLNILINARDAMPDGGMITVQAAVDRVPERLIIPGFDARPGDYVTITVTDTGVGMDSRTLERIFEPFFTTKERGKGTGLGLAVVYGVANAHGGYVTVRSVPGSGSTFILHFPLLSGAEGYRRSSRQTRMARGTERVLVVDDETEVGEIIGNMLTSLGYQTTIVDSGRKAVALIRKKERFDVVVLDLNMPKMSGKDTLIKLRAIDQRLPIVISTGYSDQMAALGELRDRANAFLQKPYQLEELSSALRAVLDHAS